MGMDREPSIYVLFPVSSNGQKIQARDCHNIILSRLNHELHYLYLLLMTNLRQDPNSDDICSTLTATSNLDYFEFFDFYILFMSELTVRIFLGLRVDYEVVSGVSARPEELVNSPN